MMSHMENCAMKINRFGILLRLFLTRELTLKTAKYETKTRQKLHEVNKKKSNIYCRYSL